MKGRNPRDRLAEVTIRPRRHGRGFGTGIAGDTQQRLYPGSGLSEFVNQVKPVPVRQAKVHDRDRGPVHLQMAPRGAQTVRPPDARAGAQAEQAHRLAGETAVFHGEHGQPQQRSHGGRGRDRDCRRIVLVHLHLLLMSGGNDYAPIPNGTLI